jgi:hypothetical protein
MTWRQKVAQNAKSKGIKMISVNTNIGAMAAIQNLASTNRDLQTTQNAISTGKKVATAKDNGAIWTIANKMSSDVMAYGRVRESNERAGAILDTGIAAADSIMVLLNEMKGKALAATQLGLSAASQAALAADFAQLRDQITNVVANASFDGANMVNATPASAISLGDAAGGNTITVAGANLSLVGHNHYRVRSICPRHDGKRRRRANRGQHLDHQPWHATGDLGCWCEAFGRASRLCGEAFRCPHHRDRCHYRRRPQQGKCEAAILAGQTTAGDSGTLDCQ